MHVSTTHAADSVPPPAAPDGFRPTLAEAAYQELKRKIIMVELEPGSQFREADIVASLGLGKTPVREALLRLSLDGLVCVQSRSGYSVAPVTLESARATFEFRVLVEGETAFRAASARGELIDAVRAADNTTRQIAEESAGTSASWDTEGLRQWLQADAELHLAVARAAANDLMAQTVARLLDEYARLCFLATALNGDAAWVPHDHGSLVQAIAEGDPSRAREFAINEMQRAEGLLIRTLLASRSLSTVNVDPRPAQRRSAFYLDVPAIADGEESS
jgi:DNA-binding GntR family transcriptional regulator